METYSNRHKRAEQFGDIPTPRNTISKEVTKGVVIEFNMVWNSSI